MSLVVDPQKSDNQNTGWNCNPGYGNCDINKFSFVLKYLKN